MKILIFGDIYGRVGRKGFLQEIDKLKTEYQPDFVIANIENISSGRGPVTKHAELIADAGVDLMTTGDHVFDNLKNFREYLQDENNPIVRPANFYETAEFQQIGVGYKIITKNNKKLLVIQLLGEVFMGHKVLNPFIKVDEILSSYKTSEYDAVILDFHRETTAELYGMAHYLAGRVHLVFGTHTHIQTNDSQILSSGTALISDVGMNGPYNSVIGASFESVKKRFFTGVQKGKIEQSLDPKYIINALYIEIDDANHKTTKIKNISYTGILK